MVDRPFKAAHRYLAPRSGYPTGILERSLTSENSSSWAIARCCLHDDNFSRFDTIPGCKKTDKQTDRQTQDHSIYGARIASRGKNHAYFSKDGVLLESKEFIRYKKDRWY